MDSSDISNKSLDFQSITNKTCPRISQSIPDLYQNIITFNQYKPISTHIQYYSVLKKFLQNQQYKVLFVFGPSGCGKHLFIKHHLEKNQIRYTFKSQKLNINERLTDQNCQMEEQIDPFKVVPLKEIIFQSLKKTFMTQIEIYEDFPITCIDSENGINGKNFKIEFYKAIKSASCKIIFILNSDIYNSFYIETSEYESSVLSFKMRAYTNTENKGILKHFSNFHTQLTSILSNKEQLTQILEIANGDARKMLLNAYLAYLRKKSAKFEHNKSINRYQKAQNKLKLKSQKKYPLFHLMGKYLYAKRLDTTTMKDRVFTRSQLQSCDPPFYFNPVQALQKSCLPLSIFSDLIFQNYLHRYGSLRDCRQILDTYIHLDSKFPSYVKKKNYFSHEKSQHIYMFLLTWGIILKNKDASLNKKSFSSFNKARNNFIVRQANQKKSLIKKYLSSDVKLWVKFGYMLIDSHCTKNYLITKILNKNVIKRSALNQDIFVLSQQQQQKEEVVNINQTQIKRIIIERQEDKKKKDNMLKQMMYQLDDSASDISSD